MAWINVIEDDKATGELKEIYKEIKKQRKKISNIMKIHSLNPQAMKTHMDLYLALMFGSSGLLREERELIGIVVSAANSCEYCVNHHAEALNHFWKDKEKIKGIIKDFKSVDLPERLHKMLEYVVKLTGNPNVIKQDDVNALRKVAFSDEDILNINLITSYFCFVNRIALGLGVEFTADEMIGYKY